MQYLSEKILFSKKLFSLIYKPFIIKLFRFTELIFRITKLKERFPMTFQQKNISFRPLGDSALVVQLGEGIDPAIHNQVKQLSILLENAPFNGFIEAVPSYNNLTIYYDPTAVYTFRPAQVKESIYQIVCNYISKLLLKIDQSLEADARLVEIPVMYGGQYGPDLEYVAAHNGLTTEEVIHIHSSTEYLVYMLGFAPGFPFMGGMDERLATPRKDSPRLSIPQGSVGIAGKQTGVYPLETPGGWQLIGQTPVELFLPDRFPPTLLQPGDKVRFVPITSEDFKRYKEMKR